MSKDEEEEDEEEKSFSIVRTQKLATGKGIFFGFYYVVKVLNAKLHIVNAPRRCTGARLFPQCFIPPCWPISASGMFFRPENKRNYKMPSTPSCSR